MPALELGFIQLLLKDPELAVCAEGLDESDLSHPLARRIFCEIKNLEADKRARAAAELIVRIPEEAALIMKLSVDDIPSDLDPAQNAAKTVKMLKKNSRERRRKELNRNYSTLTPSQRDELKHLTELRGKAGEL